jgi:hypothetical protein
LRVEDKKPPRFPGAAFVLANSSLAGRANRWFAICVSQPYEEILEGASLPRSAPGPRHEQICARRHAAMAASVANLNSTPLLHRALNG